MQRNSQVCGVWQFSPPDPSILKVPGKFLLHKVVLWVVLCFRCAWRLAVVRFVELMLLRFAELRFGSRALDCDLATDI